MMWAYRSVRTRALIRLAECPPREYHLENVPKERKKARWEHEMVLSAHQEIDMLAARGKVNVNKHRAEAFSQQDPRSQGGQQETSL